METLVAALELAAKYAWAFFLVSCIVLWLPDPIAARMTLQQFRSDNAPYIWIVLMLTGVLALGTSLALAKSYLWRFIACPCKKLLFPIRDPRTKLKQSRVRYYRVRIKHNDGSEEQRFYGVSSNGGPLGYYDDQGSRVFPAPSNAGHEHLNGGQYESPKWATIDWQDVFNPNPQSGTWGIVER